MDMQQIIGGLQAATTLLEPYGLSQEQGRMDEVAGHLAVLNGTARHAEVLAQLEQIRQSITMAANQQQQLREQWVRLMATFQGGFGI
ncbi:hypothetical protein C1701_14035 [Actinoalloteichus sp. AHMU CJ021]|uniref:hypothetical protein n=1 Tax=Actinoalloteichus sp. AHMU CJ021 TaxID=2072503 RepID=UPI000CA01CAD|nr:hypothetical protein C1701_14035 [Actinoalloteichus sp. AHMU CJ021]